MIMCGICGVVSYKNDELPKCMRERAVKLLKEIESRGKSAFGIYVYNPKFNIYIKEPRDDIQGHLFKIKGSVSNFFKEMEGEINLENSSIFLAHTRAPTSGSVDDNENNHPFMTKDFILAHNGVISNDNTLKEKYNLKYESECDSAIIIHLIQHFYDLTKDVVESIRRTTEELSGSYACWLFHKKTKKVYLFRHSNPIHYFIDKRNKCIVFASEFKHIDNVYDKKLTYSDVSSLPENKIFVIDDGELKCLGEFKTSSEFSKYSSRIIPNKYSITSSEVVEMSEEELTKEIKELKHLFDDWLIDHPEEYVNITLWDDALEIRISSEKLYKRITSHDTLNKFVLMREPPTNTVMLEIFVSELPKLLPYFRYVTKSENDIINNKIVLEKFAKFLDGSAIFFTKGLSLIHI